MQYQLGFKSDRVEANGNKVLPEDLAVHDWYRFVLSFPPHLVRHYLTRFGASSQHIVLDPFCGTGTTLVECKKLGIPAVGVEAHPMTHFAGQVKTDWTPDPTGLAKHAERIAAIAAETLKSDGISDPPARVVRNQPYRTLDTDSFGLLLKDSISARPLHKVLVLLDILNRYSDERYHEHELLALAKAVVYSISNLHFGPEVGLGYIKYDAPVISPWVSNIRTMCHDLQALQQYDNSPTVSRLADSRNIVIVLEPRSIDIVITSPPYPNEKDYTRTTRLESVLLGFIRNKAELQGLKRNLLRSNTRNVYKGDNDDTWIDEYPEISHIAETIENKRIALGKTSGFERLYAKVTRLYFGGMARHLADLRHVLRPGAQLAYVVGDQASYLRVMIRTGQLLAKIAQSLGYELVGIDLFRTRLATATREQLREEVVLLRWRG
jgi:hypothetical protein